MKKILKIALFTIFIVFNQNLFAFGRFSPLDFHKSLNEVEKDYLDGLPDFIQETNLLDDLFLNDFEYLKNKFTLPKEELGIFVKNILNICIEKEKERLMPLLSPLNGEFDFDYNFDFLEKDDIPQDSTSYTIIGDLHGNFEALEDILNDLMNRNSLGDDSEYFIPVLDNSLKLAPGNKMICLGDYIDRGPSSLETILTLMILKLKNPDSVILLRGNHEDFGLFCMYGFYYELEQKLKLDEDFEFVRDISYLFEDYFVLLPTAYFLKNKNKAYFQFNHGGWNSCKNIEQEKTFLGSDQKILLINGLDASNFKWNDLKINNSMDVTKSDRGEGFVFSTAKAFIEMESFNILAKFGGHQHNLLGQNKNPCDYSNGFYCIKDDNSPRDIFVVISGSIYPLEFGYKYYSTYLKLNILDDYWNVDLFSKKENESFELVDY